MSKQNKNQNKKKLHLCCIGKNTSFGIDFEFDSAVVPHKVHKQRLNKWGKCRKIAWRFGIRVLKHLKSIDHDTLQPGREWNDCVEWLRFLFRCGPIPCGSVTKWDEENFKPNYRSRHIPWYAVETFYYWGC
eukprot:419657_1